MYASLGEEVAAVLTDAEGRWRSEALPATAGPDSRLDVEFTHPDHFAVESRMTAEEARKLSSVQVMKAGAAVTGTVISPTGRPVAGAAVVFSGRHGSGSSVRLKTDEQGRFHTGRFVAPDRPEVTLTVQADGFASAIRRITATPGTPPQVIKLDPRKPMRGRVVDSQGRPIPGAAVASTDGLGNGALAWEAETDAEGRFVWYEAPATGTVSLDAYKSPFQQALGRRVRSRVGRGHDHPASAAAPARDRHRRRDRPAGRAVHPGHRLGPERPGGRPEWLHGNPNNKTFTNGRYDIPDGLFPDQGMRRSIRIEADGYLPGEFLGFLDNVEDIAHDFKLRKAAPLTGIVRGPDGRPIAGADVALSNADNDARIQNGRLVANRVVGEALHTRTDIDGRFRFPPQEKPVSVVAAHDAGFAVRSPEELAAIDRDQAGALGPDRGRPQDRHRAGGRAEGGRLAARQGVPGPGRLRRRRRRIGPVRLRAGDAGPDDGLSLRRRRGPHGLDGRRTRSMWTSGRARRCGCRSAARAGRSSAGSPCRRAPRWPTSSSATAATWRPAGPCRRPRMTTPTSPTSSATAWWDAFRKTPEGRAYFENGEREYAVDLRPDGTFRIEDVPAGRYILTLPFEGTDRAAIARAVGHSPAPRWSSPRCPAVGATSRWTSAPSRWTSSRSAS